MINKDTNTIKKQKERTLIMKSTKATNKIVSLLLVMAMLTSVFCIPQPSVHAETEETTTVTNTKPQAEKITQKTENATVYGDGTGKKRAEIYAQDIRFKDEKGKLTDYDTSLKDITERESETGENLATYDYQTTTTDKMTYFPQKITTKTPILSEYDQYAVKINPKETVQTGTLKKEGKEAMQIAYETKKKGVDYQYESTTEGLKESIVLDEKTDKHTFEFDITLKNCSLISQDEMKKASKTEYKNWQTKEGESVFLYDIKEDRLIGTLPAAFMIDAEGNYSEACNYSISLMNKNNDEKQYHMVLKVSKQYLEDADRAYPVTIDPTVTWNTSDVRKFSSAYVCSTAPNSNYTDGNTNILCVGKRDTAKDLCRAYLKFEGVESLLAGMYVEKANLELNFHQSDAGMKMYVRQVTSGWGAPEITYSNQPKRAETLAEITASANMGKTTVPLDEELLDSRARDEGRMCGYEITTSKDDSDTSSGKSAWIYNSVSVNGTKIPKLTIEYYDKEDYTDCPRITYKVYDEGKHWSVEGNDGGFAGDNEGEDAMAARAFQASVSANGYSIPSTGIKYRAYGDEAGWSAWKTNGAAAGDTSKTYNMKAVEMQWNTTSAENAYYDLYYRVYVPGRGWLGWAKNAQTAGDYTKGNYISAMEAVIVPKIRYRLEYVASDGTSKVTDPSPGNKFCFNREDSKIITGIGIAYVDQKLNDKYNISIRVYTNDRKSIQDYAIKGGKLSIVGNGKNITGYSASFLDVTHRMRYNIQHVGSSLNANLKDGKWENNEVYSGDVNENELVKILSVRSAPKDYIAGKRACITGKFRVDEDGYGFVNTWGSFGYSAGYKVPKEKYIALYGEVRGTQIYESETWQGACFAMSLSSQLFFHKYWDMSKAVSNMESGSEMLYNLYPQYLKKDKKIRDLLEYLQISQSISIQDRPQGSDCFVQEDYARIVNWLQQDSSQSHILYVGGTNGCHAVVPLNIKQKNNGDYDIEIYDNNIPGKIVHGTINKAKTTFSYADYTAASLLNIEKFYKARPELYNVIWRNSVYGENNKYVWNQNSNQVMVIGADRVCISDESGKEIKTDVKSLIDENGKICYNLPKGKYKLSVKELNQEKAQIVVMNSDNSTRYTIVDEGNVTIEFGKEKMIKTSLNMAKNRCEEIQIRTLDKNNYGEHRKFFGQKVLVKNEVNNIKYERK